MKRALSCLLLGCLLSVFTFAAPQKRRTRVPKRKPSAPTASYAQKQQAEIQSGRERIASQIKTLTQFLYLLGGVSKGIETAELANKSHEDSSAALSAEQIEKNKARVRESIKNVRVGLDQLESSFRMNPVLTSYYPNISGVAKLAQTAENQAAAGRLDEAGRSLLSTVSKLADALVSLK